MRIPLATDESPVMAKTRELCQTILDQPAYQDIKEAILAFVQDDKARQLYERLCDKQDALQAKERQGVALLSGEIEDFEKLEAEFLGNPLAQGFISAQRKMHKIEESVAQYVRKTFELGRVPNDADFDSGSCGPGCGCHG